MSSATIDRLLAVLVLAMAGTGIATLRAGMPASGWLFVLHGSIAGALALTVVLKLRGSVGKAARAGRWGRLVFGSAIGLIAIAALSGGYLWVAGGRLLSIGGWTVLTLHAWAGLVLVPLVVIHILPRRWLLLRPHLPGPRAQRTQPTSGVRDRMPLARKALSRRAILTSGALAIAGGGGRAVAELLDRASGGARRFTGSRALPPGGIPPPTTFYGEPDPVLDESTWSISVRGRVTRPLRLGTAALAALVGTTRSVTLDCTSGWSMDTDWSGVPLAAVLDLAAPSPAARRVVVRSATGWSAVLPLNEARDCLLATGVAGGPLPSANGRPCRLVAPDRRGLDWVKWVTEIELT